MITDKQKPEPTSQEPPGSDPEEQPLQPEPEPERPAQPQPIHLIESYEPPFEERTDKDSA